MSSRCGREESLDVVGGLTARKWVHVHNSGTAGWGRSRQMTPRAAATERACRGSMLFPPDPDHDSRVRVTGWRVSPARVAASEPHHLTPFVHAATLTPPVCATIFLRRSRLLVPFRPHLPSASDPAFDLSRTNAANRHSAQLISAANNAALASAHWIPGTQYNG